MLEFQCPHCKIKQASAARVQSSDDLNWLRKGLNYSQELWQCNCGGYFRLTYKLEMVEKLSFNK